MQKNCFASRYGSTFILLGIAIALGVIFRRITREQPLNNHVPEFIALMLLAGTLYVVSVYLVLRCRNAAAALIIILGASVVLRLFCLPLSPTLSEDVYRYQWEGRIERAGINPYAVYPAMPELRWAQNPERPVVTGRMTPTLYPPLSEAVFASVHTVAGYKRLFMALDLATLVLLLILLAATGQSLLRVLIYAWNPAVIVSFALSGHNDALANLLLLATILLIIGRRTAMSITFLALSFLAKLFPIFLLPVFLKRTGWRYAGLFAGVVFAGYLPFLRAGGHLFKGLSDFTAGWEGNDSLFRLIQLAGNSKEQTQLVAGILLLGLIVYVIKTRADLFQSALAIIAGLLFLSPNAFPWYFTWMVPCLCFYPDAAILLMTVTCVLGYSPVVAYAAGLSYKNMPLMLALEYAPVFGLLAWRGLRLSPAAGGISRSSRSLRSHLKSY